MAKRATTGVPTRLMQREYAVRSRRVEALLGRDWRVALPFILPMLIIMVGLISWPFVNAIGLSFTVRSVVTKSDQFIGLRNYVRLWQDADYRGAVSNTVVFTAASIVSKLIVGMTIALLLNSRLPFRNVITGLMLLPWIVPEVVTAMAWRSIYDPIFGGLNPILQGLGLTSRAIAWLSEPRLAMPSVIAVNIWKGIPFYTMLLLAGLKSIDRELYEAAEVDGASVTHRFRHITLPGLKYVIIVTMLLSTISTFNTFGLVYLMTGGGPGGATRLYSILAYERAIIGLRYGPGAAVALSLAPLLALCILVLARFMRPDAASRADDTVVDRALGLAGTLLTMLIDVILWPFARIAEAFGSIAAATRSRQTTTRPFLTRAGLGELDWLLRVLLLLPLLTFVLFPFYWVVITAFKSELQIQQYHLDLTGRSRGPSTSFARLLLHTPYLIWFRNTVLVATLSTAIAVALSALAGYALARLKFVGANALTTLLLVTYLLPSSLLFIPLYRILTNLRHHQHLRRR